jgi:hypothetical protein
MALDPAIGNRPLVGRRVLFANVETDERRAAQPAGEAQPQERATAQALGRGVRAGADEPNDVGGVQRLLGVEHRAMMGADAVQDVPHGG